MSYCPSMDWDRYCRDNDPPEVCPKCGGENCTEDGEPVCVEAPDFCSVTCRDLYTVDLRAADEAESRWQAEMDAMQPEIDAAIEGCQEVERDWIREYDLAADDLAYDAAREDRYARC